MTKAVSKEKFESVPTAQVRPGMQVRVHQKIKDVTKKGEEKMRTQIFEGLVIARKHGNEPGATFTVRKVSEGIGVERTWPIFTPLIEKIEVVDRKKVSRAKLYFTRTSDKHLRSQTKKKVVSKKVA